MNRQYESGRSMVEMLGVLAIIGVLSVTGIAGYTMALNKYHANEIVETASKLHMLYVANKEINSAASYSGLDEAGLNRPYGNVDLSVDADGNIKVTGADPKVCSMISQSFASEDFTVSCS